MEHLGASQIIGAVLVALIDLDLNIGKQLRRILDLVDDEGRLILL